MELWQEIVIFDVSYESSMTITCWLTGIWYVLTNNKGENGDFEILQQKGK